MVKTAVGLFKQADAAEATVRDIQSLGVPRMELRTLDEPLDFGETGVMSIPHIDFEVQVYRELERIGASSAEAQAYVEGLRQGGVIVFATCPDDKKVDGAAEIMNRHGAVEAEETKGPEPEVPGVPYQGMASTRGTRVQGGRIRQSGGACCFVW